MRPLSHVRMAQSHCKWNWLSQSNCASLKVPTREDWVGPNCQVLGSIYLLQFSRWSNLRDLWFALTDESLPFLRWISPLLFGKATFRTPQTQGSNVDVMVSELIKALEKGAEPCHVEKKKTLHARVIGTGINVLAPSLRMGWRCFTAFWSGSFSCKTWRNSRHNLVDVCEDQTQKGRA